MRVYNKSLTAGLGSGNIEWVGLGMGVLGRLGMEGWVEGGFVWLTSEDPPCCAPTSSNPPLQAPPVDSGRARVEWSRVVGWISRAPSIYYDEKRLVAFSGPAPSASA